LGTLLERERDGARLRGACGPAAHARARARISAADGVRGGLLTHPQSATYAVTTHASLTLAEWLSMTNGDRGRTHDRWLRGMRRLRSS
jgi:hypothetical protein